MNLPKHACSLSITHNPHLDYYESVAEHLAGLEDRMAIDWPSPEDKAVAIAKNDFWEMQWYPNTPIGFNLVMASSLEGLLKFALEVESK